MTGPAIGRAMPRADARRLVAGGGRYVDDHAMRGELHACFLRSPLPHALFTLDVAPAAALPGVHAVLTAADLAPVCRPWRTESRSFPGLVSPEQGPLVVGRATWQGEPVAMVVAASRAIAEDAAEAILADWDELPAVTSPEAALAPGAPLVHPGSGGNLAWGATIGGDVEAAFVAAAQVVEERLVFTRHTGVPLEPRGVRALWEPGTGGLTLRVSHQMPGRLPRRGAPGRDLPHPAPVLPPHRADRGRRASPRHWAARPRPARLQPAGRGSRRRDGLPSHRGGARAARPKPQIVKATRPVSVTS